jgi:hypothetical protein
MMIFISEAYCVPFNEAKLAKQQGQLQVRSTYVLESTDVVFRSVSAQTVQQLRLNDIHEILS